MKPVTIQVYPEATFKVHLLRKKYFPKYDLVNLYLDNDKAGTSAANHLIKNHKNVIDQSDCYINHKDLNDLLCYERER